MKKIEIFLLILCLTTASSSWAKDVTVKAYVDGPTATCRESLAKDSKVLHTFQKGAKLEVTLEDFQDKYVKTQCNGKLGYVRKYEIYLYRPGQSPKGWETARTNTSKAPLADNILVQLPVNKAVETAKPVASAETVSLVEAQANSGHLSGLKVKDNVKAVVKVFTVNVRDVATKEKVIGELNKGTVVEYLPSTRDNKWVTVKYKSDIGAIRRWALNFSDTNIGSVKKPVGQVAERAQPPLVAANKTPKHTALHSSQSAANTHHEVTSEKKTLRQITIEVTPVETESELMLKKEVQRLKDEVAQLGKISVDIKGKEVALTKLATEVNTQSAEVARLKNLIAVQSSEVDSLKKELEIKETQITTLSALTPVAAVVTAADSGEEIFLNGVGKAVLARKGETVIFRVSQIDKSRADKLLGIIAKEKYSQNGYGYYVVDAQAVNL